MQPKLKDIKLDDLTDPMVSDPPDWTPQELGTCKIIINRLEGFEGQLTIRAKHVEHGIIMRGGVYLSADDCSILSAKGDFAKMLEQGPLEENQHPIQMLHDEIEELLEDLSAEALVELQHKSELLVKCLKSEAESIEARVAEANENFLTTQKK